MVDINHPTAPGQIVALPEDPYALARTILDHHDPDYAVRVYEALERVVAPSVMDVLAEMCRGYMPPPDPDPTTFSDLQLDIVRHIYREEQAIKQEYDAGLRRSERWWHVLWRPEDLGGDMTPSRHASISRSLRRLAERRIVYRWPGPSGRRSVSVNLTPDGTKLAKRLANE